MGYQLRLQIISLRGGHNLMAHHIAGAAWKSKLKPKPNERSSGGKTRVDEKAGMKWDEIAGKERKAKEWPVKNTKEKKKDELEGNHIDMSDTACHPKCRPLFWSF